MIDGIDTVDFFTNETIFDELNSQPSSMIVLGGGPIGCELGQAFARLGIQVTIVQVGPQMLPAEDRDVGEFMQRQLAAEGVTIRLNVRAKRASRAGSKTVLEFDHNESISADVLLIAAGRTPNLEALDLEAAGIACDEDGVMTNEYLQTSQRHIYAAGDVTNRLKFTHTADFTARIVVRNVLMPLQLLRQKVNWSIVPWCTFTEPEVAHVGLGEKDAQKRGINHDIYKVDLAHIDRAVVESEEAGFAKILTRKGSDEILGLTIVAPQAGELVHEFVVAMHARVGLGRIANMIHVYPTFAELARKAGDQFNKTRLTPRAKNIFHWLYRCARG
jgi:pyruvate/2-oxoglutarate dehydrogenase complex dihydrolipoamide dehydrogenase (E3) component